MEFEEVEVNSERWFDLTLLLNEKFRNVEGFEGHYQISNYGRVKSLKRSLTQYNGYGYFSHSYKERILSLCRHKQGYLMVNLTKECKRHLLQVHRLVAIAFIPNPNNLPDVNHKKPVTFESCINRVDNLEWCTQKENVEHCIKLNRRCDFKGSKSPCAKKVILKDKNNNVIKEYGCFEEVAKDLNISKALVCMYLKDKIKNKKYNILYKEDGEE
jgi:hypothetical protein